MRLCAGLCLTLVASGCASVGPRPVPRVDPSLNVGQMGARTNFELRAMVANPEPGAAAPGDRGARKQRRRARLRKVTPPLFWTGIVMSVVGGAGTLGFGIAGVATESRINNDFDTSLSGGEGLSKADYDALRARGDVFNVLTITSAVIGLVGMGLAAIVYGYDFTHCGPLAPERRRCSEAGYRDE